MKIFEQCCMNTIIIIHVKTKSEKKRLLTVYFSSASLPTRLYLTNITPLITEYYSLLYNQ